MRETEVIRLSDIPFEKGSIPYRVMKGSLERSPEGGWADLSPRQIGEVLDVPYKSINSALHQIKRKTGYEVPHISEWEARKRAEWGDEEDVPL